MAGYPVRRQPAQRVTHLAHQRAFHAPRINNQCGLVRQANDPFGDPVTGAGEQHQVSCLRHGFNPHICLATGERMLGMPVVRLQDTDALELAAQSSGHRRANHAHPNHSEFAGSQASALRQQSFQRSQETFVLFRQAHAQDRQSTFYGGDAFHVLWLLELAPGQRLEPSLPENWIDPFTFSIIQPSDKYVLTALNINA